MAYGSQTPYWDDWGMGRRMALYMESGFDFTWLYGLTNGHRSAFSKLTNMLFFILNDHQWEPYLTMVLNAVVWAISGVFLIYIGFRERLKINSWLFCGLIIVLWSYPLSLFNILSTVQTYLYYMVLFSVCGFWLVTDRVLSLKWWCGICLIAAACLTTGGGSFAPVSVACAALFMALCDKQNRRQHFITAGLASLFAVFGLYLILSQGGKPVLAEVMTLGDFLTTLFKTLSWPASDRLWPAAIYLLPIVLLAFAIIGNRIAPSRLVTFTITMAGFGIMLAMAIAYARGTDGNGPTERYFDFLTLYCIASALSLMLIRRAALGSQRHFCNILTVLWLVTCIVAVPYHLRVYQFQLNDKQNLVPVQEDIMARYSVTGDPEIFEKRAFRQVPFPRKGQLQDMMALLHRTDAQPYTLQASSMQLGVRDNAFVVEGIPMPISGRYRRLESVLGSFNKNSGAQLATGEYTSEVFIAKRPYVMIPVSGHLGAKGTSLTMVGEDNGKTVDIHPKTQRPGRNKTWREVLVAAPDKRFRIIAKDNSTEVWFAFAAPRSVGRLSYLADRIIANGKTIWRLGLLLILVALVRASIGLYHSRNTRNSTQQA